MNELLQQLASSPWTWGVAGALAGVVVARRWGGADARPLGGLWLALGGRDACPTGAAAWPAIQEQAQRQHEAAQRSQQLQLRTVAAELRLAITDSVLANLQDGIVVVDPTEQILFANTVAKRVLQLDDLAARGDGAEPHLADAKARTEIVDGVRAVLAADLARSVKTCRIDLEENDQRFVYVIRAIAEAPVPGARAAQVVVLEDWTAEERAARAKSEFIYGVSHELKTPLTAIQASLELANEPEGLAAEDRDKLIRVSYEESVRLSQMVAELLDLARIEAGITEFKRETVNMRELLVNLQAIHQPLADRKSIGLAWTISDYLGDLVGDARLLRQALVNIVGNALKYTKSGGEVSLTARLEGHELVTRVRDTGIGIAPEDLGRIFEKFFRAKSAEQSTIPGTGLGLPMARYIVERHRGRIELSSELGVGTEFRVYLPASTAEQEEEGASTLLAVDGASE
jgi:signal transduction histidine kinase